MNNTIKGIIAGNAPNKVVLTNIPSAFSNVSSLSVIASGQNIVAYRYKVGLNPSVNCQDETGYSEEMKTSENIIDVVPADNEYVICAVGKNKYGKWQDFANATRYKWIKDTTPPSSPSIVINSGSTYTISSMVSLSLSANDDPYQMYITNTAGCASGGLWLPYGSTSGWSLNQTNNTVSVYVKFRDLAGNESSCVNDSIVHDSLAPGGVSSVTLGSVPVSLSQSPTVSFLSANENGPSGIDYYEAQVLRSSDNEVMKIWTSFASGDHFTSLSLTNNVSYYVSIRTVDRAGNRSSPVHSSSWIAIIDLTASLSNTPSSPSNAASLNVSVGGANITSYAYKMGLSGSTDCSLALGYSGSIAQTTNITNNIGTDGNYTLCVIGSNGTFWQSHGSATSYSWTKDTVIDTPPTSLALDTVPLSLASTPVLYFTNASDSRSGIASHQAQLIKSSDSSIVKNWQTFTSGSHFTGLTLIEGESYYFQLKATDNADNTAIVNSPTWVASELQASNAVLSLLPANPSNGASLDVVVGGTNITQYKYKLGSEASIDCSNSSGYSSSIAISTHITDALGGYAEGSRLKLCVVGGDVGSRFQSYSSATSHIWTRGVLRFLSFNTHQSIINEGSGTTPITATINLDTAINMNIRVYYSVSGTAVYGIDHNLYPGYVDILANQTSVDIHFDIFGNSTTESDRTVVINLSGTDTALTGFGMKYQYLLQINDDDPTPRTLMSKVASGANFTCAIDANGVLKCWGRNSNGQVGNGTIVDQSSPTLINSGTSYSQISNSTSSHACGITTAGVLKCWGYNLYYRLGDGTITDRHSPTVIDSGVSYSQISAHGGAHTCGITTTGVLKCWGYNIYGQIGNGTKTSQTTPTVIDSGTPYSQIAEGYHHTCAITSTGVLKCWGYNILGQLGDGTNSERITPIVIDGGTTYSQITAGNHYTCGITTTGILKCWGNNTYGQVGDGSTSNRHSPKVIDSGTTYSQISGGSSHTCGITTTGILKCWGMNSSGQLGDGTTTNKSIPTIIETGTSYSQIAAGGSYTCGITSTGILKCWGENTQGQLGDSTTAYKLFPDAIDSSHAYDQIAEGASHSCGITSTGILKCWGMNSSGQLGDNSLINRSSPNTIDSGTSYSGITVGNAHNCGITSTRILKCWGDNTQGQLGDGTNTSRSSPTVINSGTLYSKTAAGDMHTCGVTTTGILKCWGGNTQGQLGDGTNTSRSTPTVIDSGVFYSQIAGGVDHSCGITTTGVLKCWGNNGYGQLGDGTTTNQLSPTVIDSGVFYSQIVAGTAHTCGITTTGILKCWGNNAYGKLGDGTTSDRHSPIVVDSGISYSQISGGGQYNCGITQAGILKCWGYNSDGQLGDGTKTNKSIPTVIDSGSRYSRIAGSDFHTCGTTDSGTLKCWGNNSSGQVGNGVFLYLPKPIIISLF